MKLTLEHTKLVTLLLIRYIMLFLISGFFSLKTGIVYFLINPAGVFFTKICPLCGLNADRLCVQMRN